MTEEQWPPIKSISKFNRVIVYRKKAALPKNTSASMQLVKPNLDVEPTRFMKLHFFLVSSDSFKYALLTFLQLRPK